MDIKRVAFETKPVNKASTAGRQPPAEQNGQALPDAVRRVPKREEIAAIVDSFLSKKIADMPKPEPASNGPAATPVPVAQVEAKTVIHEITPENAVQKPVPITPVDFVSEDDVRRAIANGDKIFISKKTILTPSARDLGEEKEVFARV
jgi:hypothetical protein